MRVSGPSTIANIAWLKMVYLNRGMILVFWGILPSPAYIAYRKIVAYANYIHDVYFYCFQAAGI